MIFRVWIVQTFIAAFRVCCYIGLDCLDEVIEIMATSLNIFDKTNIIHRPVPMDQAVSEIEKWLEALKKVFGDEPAFMCL